MLSVEQKLLLKKYENNYRSLLGSTVDLRSGQILPTNEIQNISILNDNFKYDDYVPAQLNNIVSDQSVYKTIRDYTYKLNSKVDANASYPMQFVNARAELDVTLDRTITEKSEIEILEFNFSNEVIEITINESTFFSLFTTPINKKLKDDIDTIIYDNESLEIKNPGSLNCWEPYRKFFNKYKTHMISSVTLGSKYRINYSVDKKDDNDIYDLKSKACVKLTPLTEEQKTANGDLQKEATRLRGLAVTALEAAKTAEGNAKTERNTAENTVPTLKLKQEAITAKVEAYRARNTEKEELHKLESLQQDLLNLEGELDVAKTTNQPEKDILDLEKRISDLKNDAIQTQSGVYIAAKGKADTAEETSKSADEAAYGNTAYEAASLKADGLETIAIDKRKEANTAEQLALNAEAKVKPDSKDMVLTGSICGIYNNKTTTTVTGKNIKAKAITYGGGSAEILTSILGESPFLILNNRTVIENFIKGGTNLPGIISYSYIPIWDVITKLYGQTFSVKSGGVLRLIKFIKNLKKYYLISGQSMKSGFINSAGNIINTEDTTNYFEIRDSDTNKNNFLIYNRTQLPKDLLEESKSKEEDRKVLGIDAIWPDEVNNKQFIEQKLYMGCPPNYNTDGNTCNADNNYYNKDDCGKGFSRGEYDYIKQNYKCKVSDDTKELKRDDSRKIKFLQPPNNTNKTDNTMSTLLSSTYNMTNNMTNNINKPINNLKNPQSTNQIWKMDTLGRIHLGNNTNLCLERDGTGNTSLQQCKPNDDNQRFILKNV